MTFRRHLPLSIKTGREATLSVVQNGGYTKTEYRRSPFYRRNKDTPVNQTHDTSTHEHQTENNSHPEYEQNAFNGFVCQWSSLCYVFFFFEDLLSWSFKSDQQHKKKHLVEYFESILSSNPIKCSLFNWNSEIIAGNSGENGDWKWLPGSGKI